MELPIEVVAVRDVTSRACRRIELRQAAVEITQQPLAARPDRRPPADALIQNDGEHVRDRAVLDDDRAVHVGFAELAPHAR
jgi:hypothetical protein